MWLGSTTVIQWIRSANVRQPTFVANRVAELLDTSTVDEWHYIAGVKNPANLGTRRFSFDDASRSEWTQGPEWLKQPIVLEEDNQHPPVKSIAQNSVAVKINTLNFFLSNY